jgi:hypothetical protein
MLTGRHANDFENAPNLELGSDKGYDSLLVLVASLYDHFLLGGAISVSYSTDSHEFTVSVPGVPDINIDQVYLDEFRFKNRILGDFFGWLSNGRSYERLRTLFCGRRFGKRCVA